MLYFSDLLQYSDVFLSGLKTTVELTVLTTILGVALGTACATIRQYGNRASQRVVSVYVELIRNTPFIVQLFFIFFGLPAIGMMLSPWEASMIALTINLGAYSTEIIRAGLASISKGQIEAAKVLGLNFRQTLTRVIFVPAFEKIYPALTSQCIIVMLGSAVISQISVQDLTYAANLVQSRNFRAFESYLVTALMYLGLSILLRFAFNALGKRLFAYRTAD
ncbi:MAG: amino acid ABC transporter permease [Marinomonas foliarum]|jgi:polar amino acid transport system permease protein|uniref:Amino acid ABC transporter membrane protein 1 (PAAT family) n=1 Tax=Marinomonas foliarum TaxID=491950 RepID=A0A368ZNR0_9GAMM|nr:amino acid ABC transporter permease [Marinomonas foliarum]QRV22577.1 amino acid ABC transporter permease [Marinomonas foliarum]RCW96975.1 amino acid ABC transporter membrane protein 1 (PAAT family) [Marinomonas foliarum]